MWMHTQVCGHVSMPHAQQTDGRRGKQWIELAFHTAQNSLLSDWCPHSRQVLPPQLPYARYTHTVTSGLDNRHPY